METINYKQIQEKIKENCKRYFKILNYILENPQSTSKKYLENTLIDFSSNLKKYSGERKNDYCKVLFNSFDLNRSLESYKRKNISKKIKSLITLLN